MMQKEQFWAALKSGQFACMVKESSKGKSLLASRDVYHVMKPVFAQSDDVECMYGVFLDCKNRVIAIEKLFAGTISQMAVYPRELIKRVIEHRATGLILVHNHPSGNPSPSMEDKALTLKVALTLASIDVAVHDHVIVGDGYYSMADSGDMKTVMGRAKQMVSI